MGRERHRMQNEPAGAGQLMHHLEHVVLVEDVLGGAVVRREVVPAAMLRRNRVEVHLELQRPESRVHVDAGVGHPEVLVEIAPGARPVRKALHRRVPGGFPPERAKEIPHHRPLGTPDSL